MSDRTNEQTQEIRTGAAVEDAARALYRRARDEAASRLEEAWRPTVEALEERLATISQELEHDGQTHERAESLTRQQVAVLEALGRSRAALAAGVIAAEGQALTFMGQQLRGRAPLVASAQGAPSRTTLAERIAATARGRGGQP